MGPSYKTYNELRTKKNIHWKTIQFAVTKKDRDILRKHPKLTDYRIIHKEGSHVGNVNIIHDTIILQTWNNPPRIIEIRDPLLVEVFKNFFDILWSVAKPE